MPRMASGVPTRKVATTAYAGVLAAVLIGLARRWGHFELPPEVAGAVVTLIGFLTGYVTPPGDEERVVP